MRFCLLEGDKTMNARMTLLAAILAAVLLSMEWTGAGFAYAQDVQPSYKAAADVYKLAAEKDGVLIVVAAVPPGHKTAMHSHRAMASYWITACTARFHLPDGTFRDFNFTAGAAGFSPPSTVHATENRGSAECQVVLVEYGN
jgi:oxalate decarboxylase/phosphoglucose isomerase-like protein (cupin superfamily)